MPSGVYNHLKTKTPIYTKARNKKISKAKKGYVVLEKTRKKISKGNKNKKRTDKMKENYRKSKLGDKNPMYGKKGSQKQKDAVRKANVKRKKEGRYLPV